MDENRCRACLQSSEQLYSIFAQTIIQEIKLDYSTILMLCANVQVDLNDPYPKVICSNCSDHMKKAFTFKLMCEKSYETLQKQIDVIDFHIKNESIISDTEISKVEINEEYSEDIDTTQDIKDCIFEEEIKSEENGNFTCEECMETFKTLDIYTRHLAMHGSLKDSTVNQKKFKCRLCEKEFKTLNGLKYHIESHKGIKRYKCHYKNCTWSFIAKQAYDNHITTHTNIKTCLCNICGKAYATKDSLAHHLKTHTGLRPHKCPHCDKSYLQSSHLKKHILMHNGTKLYICESCGRSYTTNSQLKNHFRKYCGKGVEPVFKFKKSEKTHN